MLRVGIERDAPQRGGISRSDPLEPQQPATGDLRTIERAVESRPDVLPARPLLHTVSRCGLHGRGAVGREKIRRLRRHRGYGNDKNPDAYPLAHDASLLKTRSHRTFDVCGLREFNRRVERSRESFPVGENRRPSPRPFNGMQLDSEEQQHALELRFREFLETSRRDAWTFAVFGTLGAALFLVLAYLLFLVLVGRLAPFAAAGIQLLCAAALFLVYTVFGIYRTRNYWKNHETEDPDLLAAGPWIHGYWRVSFEPDLIILVFVAYSANFLTFPFYLLSQ